VVCICQGLEAELAARGVPAARLAVVPNAVDHALFGGARAPDPELAARLGLVPGKTLGFIGSFFAFEGLDLAIAAMPGLLAREPEARLLLVGGGERDAELRQQAHASPARERIVFTGRVPHADVPRYYDLIDVLVYPRRSARITELVTPLKPLEAMARSALVVASDVGGHRELIEHGRTGWLFRAGDSAALADACCAVLGDPASWPATRAAGRAFVERERNWRTNVERYRAVYERALAGSEVRA
jgi:PEP-CTERM/exosortase A-associated glycosyltransferase